MKCSMAYIPPRLLERGNIVFFFGLYLNARRMRDVYFFFWVGRRGGMSN